MALNLELGVDIVRNGTRMLVIDRTGSTIITGDGKWNDAVDNTDVTGATLLITYPDGTTETKDFLTLGYFQIAITGAFTYELFKEPNGLEKFPDGKYQFVYTITTNSATYTDNLTMYFYYNTERGIDNLWYGLAAFTSSGTVDEDYMNSCILAESLYKALKAQASFGNDAAVLSLKADIDRILSVNDINY